MPRASTPSFITEIPLRVNSKQKKILLSRFEAGRQIYNACLGESLKRRHAMKKTLAYRQAIAMKGDALKQERAALFNKARKQASFSEYALHDYVKGIRNSWLGEHIDSHTAQKIATRAYNAVNRSLFDHGWAKFKRYGGMDSLESKNNDCGIRWKDGQIRWSGLVLTPIVNRNDDVIQHGLSCRVKYVRLVQRGICGQIRFYAQLICEGEPYQKPGNTTINGKIGLDVGPSTIAEVNNAGASLKTFCSELEDRQREIGILQRQLDRQRRANNPDNYNPDGTIKRGIKLIWHNSHRYLHTRTRLKELNRRQREHRRSLHGSMQNALLRRGNEMYTEDVSYKSFQKNFGKSVNFRAPGAYMTGLEKKAVQLGGALIKFPTQTTALSQMCQCGRRKKKKLSQRQHQCECGISIQRDIYSAFLARHIVLQDGKYQFNLESARQEYPSLEAYLKTASN